MSCYFQSLAVPVILLLILFFVGNCCHGQLSTNFYSTSCPRLATIIRNQVNTAINNEARMGASLLRLHFHDCFVNGCDGSVLLVDTVNFTGEQNAGPNQNSIRGMNVINTIKSAVETACPNTVSCADILAIAARDSVNILSGPTWNVRLGRRDSRTASQSAANTNLPGPGFSLSQLVASFRNFNLSLTDLVALSGGHTIGQARCTTFRARIYNDTNINGSFAQMRQQTCPSVTGNGDNNLAPLDIMTPNSFDNRYFTNLISNRGLLHSDQELFNNGSADAIVRNFNTNSNVFMTAFTAAMIRMGDIAPLTGTNGEIRRNCSVTN